ncbi:MltR family transcriptional regulator [Candidatus Omnitrophota bacterium]
MTSDTQNEKKPRTNLAEYKWNDFFEEFQKETPRAAVILSSAFLDSLLRDLICSFMIDNSKKVDELLGSEKNPYTPLSTFSSRIKTAYCLGLISKNEYDDLNIIRKIRNKFAHVMHGYTFEEREIISWCTRFKLQKYSKVIIRILINLIKTYMYLQLQCCHNN